MLKQKVLQEVSGHAKYIDNICKDKRSLDHGIRFMTALYGSQNYGLDTETSDVDTHSIIIPSFYALCTKVVISHELSENIHIKDVDEMCRMWLKQSMNFLEIMFTPYVDVNPAFAKEYQELMELREHIVRMNPAGFKMAMLGTAHNNLKTAANTGSAKKFARAIYFEEMVEKYSAGKPFNEVMQATEEERESYLRALALDKNIISIKAVNSAHYIKMKMDQLKLSSQSIINWETGQKLGDWELRLIKKGLTMQ